MLRSSHDHASTSAVVIEHPPCKHIHCRLPRVAESLNRSRGGKFLCRSPPSRPCSRLSESGSRLQAGDGSPPPPVRAAAATVANTNSLSTSAERALHRKIRQAWPSERNACRRCCAFTSWPARTAPHERGGGGRRSKPASRKTPRPPWKIRKRGGKRRGPGPAHRPIVKLAEPFCCTCSPCGKAGCDPRGGNGLRKRRDDRLLPAR